KIQKSCLEVAFPFRKRATARRQLEVVDAELVYGRRAVIDEVADGTRGGNRIEAWCGPEAARVRVHPDIGDFLFLTEQDRLNRASQNDGDVRRPSRRSPLG